MDFLLECVGFPPDFDHDQLLSLVARSGEPTPWRDRDGRDRRLSLGGGLELRLDHGLGTDAPQVLPWFASPHRLRVAVERLAPLPESPFDALLRGVANPPVPGAEAVGDGSFPFVCHLGDRRRLPDPIRRGHVLAVSAAGFALDVSLIAPEPGADDPSLALGTTIRPLGGESDPSGCLEIGARMLSVERLANPLTGLEFDVVEVESPGRPLTLFVSRWQLGEEEMATPRPGWRLHGVFLFQGRVAGGVPRSAALRAFG